MSINKLYVKQKLSIILINATHDIFCTIYVKFYFCNRGKITKKWAFFEFCVTCEELIGVTDDVVWF